MENLEKRINELFEKYTGLNFIKCPELRNQKLMGEKIRLEPRTLTYIYMQIKSDICAEIPKEEIIEGRFDTFDNICSAVYMGMKNLQSK